MTTRRQSRRALGVRDEGAARLSSPTAGQPEGNGPLWGWAVKTVVAPLRDFPPGERRLLNVGGRSIGVFRVGDQFFAIRNRCPHQGGPLCLGHILGAAVADEPGAARIAAEPLRIACPWHGWEYDLQSGQSFIGAAMPGVRSYAVGLEPGGTLAGELQAGRARLIPGPYKAETFPVSVEDDYVVVEV